MLVCCFSGNVTFVRGTRITEPGRQAIVYQMDFDHALYCQAVRTGLLAMTRWDGSQGLAEPFTKPEKAAQLIAPDAHFHYHGLVGKMKNEDIVPGTAKARRHPRAARFIPVPSWRGRRGGKWNTPEAADAIGPITSAHRPGCRKVAVALSV